MGKNLYKTLIFFMYMYKTFLLFSYLVSRHRHTQATLSSVRDTITHTRIRKLLYESIIFLILLIIHCFFPSISGVKDRK